MLFKKKGNLRAVLYWKRFVIGWKIVNISVEMIWEKVVWKSELGFQTTLDSDFKCNTSVSVVWTDSRIKHLAFRSQVFFSAGGSTHLEPCVSPDRWYFGNRFVWGNIAGWVRWCSHSALSPKNGKGGKNRFSPSMLWLFWCVGRTLCRYPWWWCGLWLYMPLIP